MKRHLLAALAGALCAMLIAGIPLWRQNQRMEKRLTAAESGIELKNSERPVFRLTVAGKAKDSRPEKAVDRWAAAHPDAAAKSDNRPLQPSERFARAVDKKAAATKILNSSPPEKLAEAATDIVRLWNDIEAVGEWLNTLPHGRGRDTAAIAYALEAVKTEPEAAMRWAESIGDQGQRARTQRRVFAAWSDAQPAAASAWLRRSGWSEAQQQAARDIMAVSPAAGRGKAP